MIDLDACETLLPLLAEEKVRSSFALVGWLVEKHPRIVKDVLAGKHEIVNHTFSHNKASFGLNRIFEIWSFQILMKNTFNYEPKGMPVGDPL